MTNVKSIAAVCLSLAVFVPSAALSWRAWNRHEVLPVSNGVYEVVSEVGYGTGATDYWCGIGDYAQRQLRAGATQRIYIWKAVGPSVNRPGRKAVQFSLSAPSGANTSPGYSVSVKRVGDNMTVSMAQNYCQDQRVDNLRFQNG
ncbi:hypothetical protein [Falsiphaeobacter marinintestinus]|uniref:hypothetical protein n=1 Tax=Falsiphaeobacter marinintestinus TaxID=1492905 RepID=UPI0011B80643|nr:hypothetical protein [Phaeobacter marinintestinus]